MSAPAPLSPMAASPFSAESFRERARPHLLLDAEENFARPHFGDHAWQAQLGAAIAQGRRTGA